MARPGGLGRGLGALIPSGTVAEQAGGLADIPTSDIRPNPQQPARALRRGGTGLARRVDSRDRSAAAGARSRRGERRIRADRRRAPLAGRTSRRTTNHSRDHSGRRRCDDAAGRDRRERAAGRAQPARRGSGVPATHRGLLAYARRSCDPNRQEPSHDHEHVAAAPTSAEHPALRQGRIAPDGPRPGTFGDARPRVSRATRQAGGRRRPVGPRSRGGHSPRIKMAPAPGAVPNPPSPQRQRWFASTRRACSSSKSSWATTSTPGIRITMGPRHGRVQIDFANLEDLERIYRAMTQGAALRV